MSAPSAAGPPNSACTLTGKAARGRAWVSNTLWRKTCGGPATRLRVAELGLRVMPKWQQAFRRRVRTVVSVRSSFLSFWWKVPAAQR